MNLRVTVGTSIVLGGAVAIGQLHAIHAAPPIATVMMAIEASGGTVGPDIIVSRLDTIRRFATMGPITSYSISTTSCNLGDEPAEWIIFNLSLGGFVNRHPLIGQNMYRFENGRLEQIGMSWVKHAFCGVDGFDLENCAVCQPVSDCEILGIGCSDTYNTGHNGDQEDLGPRSEVNAATGAYRAIACHRLRPSQRTKKSPAHAGQEKVQSVGESATPFSAACAPLSRRADRLRRDRGRGGGG